MVRYLRVVWHHDFDDEPVLLLSEVVDGREVRKVERFRDGRAQYAGPGGSSGDTMLSKTLMPLPDEIAQDAEFSVEPTSAEDFEAEWSAAVGR
jgi:hypothetical protein